MTYYVSSVSLNSAHSLSMLMVLKRWNDYIHSCCFLGFGYKCSVMHLIKCSCAAYLFVSVLAFCTFCLHCFQFGYRPFVGMKYQYYHLLKWEMWFCMFTCQGCLMTTVMRLIHAVIALFHHTRSHPLHNIWAIVIVWRLRRKIIKTVLCCTV